MKLSDLTLLELDFLMKYYHEQMVKYASKRNVEEEKYQDFRRKHDRIVNERKNRIQQIEF